MSVHTKEFKKTKDKKTPGSFTVTNHLSIQVIIDLLCVSLLMSLEVYINLIILTLASCRICDYDF